MGKYVINNQLDDSVNDHDPFCKSKVGYSLGQKMSVCDFRKYHLVATLVSSWSLQASVQRVLLSMMSTIRRVSLRLNKEGS